MLGSPIVCTHGNMTWTHEPSGPNYAGAIVRDVATSGLAGLGDASDQVDLGLSTGQVIDFNAVMAALNQLQPSAASSYGMIVQGTRALTQANLDATGAAAQPGEQAKRDNIQAHLSYYVDHQDQLESGFYDIRNWTIQAFVAFNAVEEIAQQQLFWPSVYDALQALPSTVGQAVGAVAQTVAGVAGQAAGGLTFGILQGLFQNPLGLIALAGAAYYFFFARKSHA